jgi:hypothetical protein
MTKYGTFKYGRGNPRHTNDQFNVFNSIKWALENNTFYDNDGTTLVTLMNKYPDLNIVVGYPENMADITLPCISIDFVSSSKRKTMHLTRTKEPSQYVLDGFVGNKEGGEWNKADLLEMMNCTKCIFDPEVSSCWIYQFDFSKGVPRSRPELESLEVLDVSSRFLPVGGDETLDAVRFRFQILLTLGLYKGQSVE